MASVPDESPRTLHVREQLEQLRMENERLIASRLVPPASPMSSRTYPNLSRSIEHVQAEHERARGASYPVIAGYSVVSSPPSNVSPRTPPADLPYSVQNSSRTNQLPLPVSPVGMSSRTVQVMEELNVLKQENEKLISRDSELSPSSKPAQLPKPSAPTGMSSRSLQAFKKAFKSLRQENGKVIASKVAPPPPDMSSQTAAEVNNNEKLVDVEQLKASEALPPAPHMSSQTLNQINNNRGPADYTRAGPSGPDVSIRTLQALDELAKAKKEIELLKASKVELPGISDRTRLVMEQLEKVKRENAMLKSSRVESSGTAQRRLAYLEQNHAVASKIRMSEIKKMILTSQELDLAFLVDATGSMQPSINMIKDTVTTMAAGIREAYPECKLRVAFAPYRDYENIPQDDSEICDFTTDFTGPDSIFAQALSRVHAFGGGDDAEDVFTGIARVASLSWSATNRLLFHIADAPCHGLQFHDGVGDLYPAGDKYGRTIEAQLELLHECCRISTYFFCHLNSSTRKMLQEFKKAAGGSMAILEEQFGNISNIPHKVITLCRGTIQKTMSVVGAGYPADMQYVNEVVVTATPNWFDTPVQTGTHFRYKWYRALDDLLSKISRKMALDEEALDSVKVQIAKNPFSAEGAVRWPYYALITHPTEPARPMVVKRFKTPLGKDVREAHSRDRYLAQMEVQSVAAHMANEFNSWTSNFTNVKKVEFTEVTTLEVGSGPYTKFYNMEGLLRGEWIRHSNNGGYVNTSDYAAVLQAFTHWTHERSKGLLMVTDLQGVRMTNEHGENVFCLCDPAIHCTDVMRFTRTNLGAEGFKLFFDTHKCNDVCHNLRLAVGSAGRTLSGTQVGRYW